MLAFRPMLLTATLLLLAMNAEATIDLHLCPHSHLDVGFDWTPDVMFGRNGSENGVGKNKTRYQKSVGLVLEQAQKALLKVERRQLNELHRSLHKELQSDQCTGSALNLVKDDILPTSSGEWATGNFGGTCTCPNGQTYDVGDNNDACGSLACEGGVSGTCNREPSNGKSAARGVDVEGVRMGRVCVKGACNHEPTH